MPKTILTEVGVRKITLASGSGTQVAISHVGLGDGSGAVYDPSFDQTELQREMSRQQISSRQLLEANTWRVKVDFPPDTPSFAVREIGFFDADGDLICLWAGLDVEPRQAGVLTYSVTQTLTFTHVSEGVVVVQAPDDEVFNLALSTARGHAVFAKTLLQQAQEIRALQSEV